MSRAVLSIGSNLGDRLPTLQGGVDALRPWVSAVSAVFETPPWGPVAQGDFLNVVVLVDDPHAAPTDWLARAHAAEDAAGRTREVRWGPRTLDVDVVTVRGDVGGAGGVTGGVTSGVGEVRGTDPDLMLPHPRAAERAFVLVPWLDVDPDAVLGGTPVHDLVRSLSAAELAGVRRCPGLVLR